MEEKKLKKRPNDNHLVGVTHPMSWCSQDTGKARTTRAQGQVDSHLSVLRPGSCGQKSPHAVPRTSRCSRDSGSLRKQCRQRLTVDLEEQPS
ncbi:hypothetical protein T07_14653 [Trichinella nelsoni]|uniref:Uncharacterized protein n=1 Tax=Trichinella nelsoni TaxID=6336 RepID=A0A0V0RGH2_9BILA|nr:hypothetical protein T07_14653 [Trichinella nelsoni]